MSQWSVLWPAHARLHSVFPVFAPGWTAFWMNSIIHGGRHKMYIFKYIFFKENVAIFIWICLKFVSMGHIDTRSALVQVMDWHLFDAKPSPAPMMTQFTTAYKNFPDSIYMILMCFALSWLNQKLFMNPCFIGTKAIMQCEVTLNDMGKIGWYQTTSKHNIAQIVCIIVGMYYAIQLY